MPSNLRILPHRVSLRATRRATRRAPAPRALLPLLGLILAATALSAGCTRTLVEDCPRGDLDRRYCDRAGDLVADPPGDRGLWQNPDTLIFAYTPVEDPAQYRDVWQDFLDHLEDVTGRTVRFFPVQSNAAQIEAMRAGRLHVAGFNTGSVPLAVNCAGFRPMQMMAAADGTYGYRMEILARADSGLREVEDLRDRRLAFTSPTSNSGFKAPSVLLEELFGMQADRDFEPAFSGRHDNSVLGVLHGDYDAAAVADVVIDQVLARGAGAREDLVSLYTSDPFPTTAYGVSNRLDPALAERVEQAFATFPWEGSALAAEFADEAGFIPVTYREHWEVIRRIDVASGTSWRCR